MWTKITRLINISQQRANLTEPIHVECLKYVLGLRAGETEKGLR